MSDILKKLIKKSSSGRSVPAHLPRKHNEKPDQVEALAESFNHLSKLFNQGAWTDCEQLALDILMKFPEQGAVWKVLGAVYQQQNLKENAEETLLQAVKLLPKDAEAHYNLANFYFDQAIHDKAIQYYRKSTELATDFTIAYFNLGSVYKALGDKSLALECFKKAYALEPSNIKICLQYASSLADSEQTEEAIHLLNYVQKLAPKIAAVYFSLGILQEKQSSNEDALSNYKKTIALEPTHIEACNNHGLLLNRMGRVEEAEQAFKQALAANDQVSSFYNNLGFIYKEQKRIKEAEACFKKALVLDKDSAPAYSNFALLKFEAGNFTEAELFCLRSLEINPDYDCAHINYGLILINMNRHEEAVEHFEAALKINPNHVMAMANLAIPLKKLNRLSVAEQYLKRAIELKPDYFNAHLNLGSIYQGQGKLVECIASTIKAIEIQPDSASAYSNLLFDLSYTDAYTTSYKVETAHKYGKLLTKNAKNSYTNWHLETESSRLRVGFVSGDFLEHPVSYFLRNVVANIDQTKFDLFAYTTDAREDSATAILKNHLHWNSLVGLNDAEAAARIHDDGIHILIDLSGHTAGNRLPVFALKPAPIQATWLGYWSTTGVEQMDYIIADQMSLPLDIQDKFTEKVQYLPETRFCFAPPSIEIDVSPLPAITKNQVTLGCFQNYAKVSDDVLVIWADVLKNTPQTKLRWQTGSFKDEAVKANTLQRFSALGIPSHQIDLIGSVSRNDYFKAYHEIDFLLDSFPFSGATTTCEALWMGVPTLTLPGDTLVSRQGASLMSAVGLTEFIAKDRQDYVEKVEFFSTHLPELSIIRSALRQQLMASTLGNPSVFSNNFELALFAMWEEKMEGLSVKKRESVKIESQDTPNNVQENSVDSAIKEVYQMALNHQLNGDDVTAETLYLEILKLEPRHADANHNLGYIESARKDIDIALRRFQIALTENPHSEQFWVSFIDALSMAGDTETAKSAIEQGRKMAISQENAIALVNEIDSALWQQNQKLNCFSDAISTEIKQTKFIVVAPPYTSKSAGNHVMHQLCHDLNELGYPTCTVLYDLKTVTYSNNSKFFAPNLNHYAINGDEELQHFIDEGIVIYPEIVNGNPLNAKRVVRYVLNSEGVVAGNKMLGSSDDFILAFSPVYHSNPHAILTNTHHHKAFNDIDTLPALERKMDMTYLGKGDRKKFFVIPGSVELSRHWPETKEEVAVLLKNTRYFYSWDYRSQAVTDALLCGAIPIYLSVAPYASLEELDQREFASQLGTFGRYEDGEMQLSIPKDYDERRDRLVEGHTQNVDEYTRQLKEVLNQILKYFSVKN